MIKNPKISIVTPTYNSEMYLEKCISSIKNQKYDNYEHIIVDGVSTDGTLDIIKKYEGTYPMRWISEPDEGMYDAINKGFATATGDVYAWLNSDDFYFPWTLNVVAMVFEKRNVEWITGISSNTKQYGNEEITYQLPNMPAVFCTPLIKRGLYDGRTMYFVQQESCFWTRNVWQQVGGIEKKYKYAGDYHLWKKMAAITDLYTVQCNLASFRIHEEQKSKNVEEYYNEVGKRKEHRIESILVHVTTQLFSLAKYKKYMININELY